MQRSVTAEKNRSEAMQAELEAFSEALDDCLRERPGLMLSWLEMAEQYSNGTDLPS